MTKCVTTNPGVSGEPEGWFWPDPEPDFKSLCPTLSSALQNVHLLAFFLLILPPAAFFMTCLQPESKSGIYYPDWRHIGVILKLGSFFCWLKGPHRPKVSHWIIPLTECLPWSNLHNIFFIVLFSLYLLGFLVLWGVMTRAWECPYEPETLTVKRICFTWEGLLASCAACFPHRFSRENVPKRIFSRSSDSI